MAEMAFLTLLFTCTVIENRQHNLVRMPISSQLKNPASARSASGPVAPQRRTRATSSSQNRLTPRCWRPRYLHTLRQRSVCMARHAEHVRVLARKNPPGAMTRRTGGLTRLDQLRRSVQART